MKLHLGYILGLFAITLAGSAAYISVAGWGKLFAGEAMIVMVVMAIIESAKVVTTLYLHRYGKKTMPSREGHTKISYFFKRLVSLRTYLGIGVIATMFLTSVGIYGFLTNAYQDTANKMEVHEGEVLILEGKRDIFQIKIDDNNKVIGTKRDRVGMLSNLRAQQEARLDEYVSKGQSTNAKRTRGEIDIANTEIQKLTSDIDTIVKSNSALQDSVSSYQVQILELKSTSDVAAEIGPLKYISTLTGRPMDSIINWIVLLIIFIFDPMAISLLLAANKVFELNKKKPDGDDPVKLPDADKPILITPKNINTVDIIDTEVVDEIIDEPEPSGSTNENIEDSINEETVMPEVINIPEVIDVVEEVKIIDEQEEVLKPEDIVEAKQEPVIPTGTVKREEIKEIKQGSRGYSVNVPQPKKVGSNKEIRTNEPKKFYFKRPRID